MPHTLLLADDSVTIQRVIELTFAGEDVNVVAVSDGDEAIARLNSAPPDIVLADVGMPGKSGYEVAQYIKQSSQLSQIPVLLLTGAFEPVDQARATAAGCDGVLQKPFEPQLLISRVKELLANRRQATPVAPVMPDVPVAVPVATAVSKPLEIASMPLPIPEEDRSNQSVADQLLAEPLAPAVAIPGLDDYFDRLDAAFAGLGNPAVIQPASPSVRPPEPAVPPNIDWFAPAREAPVAAAEVEAPDLLLSPDFDAAAFFERPAPEPAAIDPTPLEIEPVFELPQPVAAGSEMPQARAEAMPPSPSLAAVEQAVNAPQRTVKPHEPLELPSIADAFASLLAAEQSEPLPATAPAWPASAPVDDALVEKVTRQVLAQLSDRIVRETVADLVSQVAERLVREEIERIKASIQ